MSCETPDRDEIRMAAFMALRPAGTEEGCFRFNLAGPNKLKVRFNVKDVLDMLTRCNFTPKQIFGGIQLVIYPSNEVAIALRKLNEETKSDPHLLNAALSNGLEYIIYLIEKESNFSGNSVFMHEKNEAKTQDKPEKDSPDC